MERSIENIWKKGFKNDGDLKAPQINNLYNQKSIHVIEKFKRMFRINLTAIVLFSLVFLIVSYLLHIFVMGVIMFFTLMILVGINKRLLNQLEKIDQGQNSYQYLTAFDQWIKMQIELNKKVSRFLYPVFFLSLVLGLWFNDTNEVYLGERLVNALLSYFPNTYLIYGVPVVGILIVLIIMAALSYYGGRIYQWDLNLIYGKILKRLEKLLAELEDLNK
ncbi:MAG: hypothetical protein WBV11_01005 [Salegentibacter sp.]